MFVFAFFPMATPVVAETMNWGVVMFAAWCTIAGVYYLVHGRRVYTPPVSLLKREQYAM